MKKSVLKIFLMSGIFILGCLGNTLKAQFVSAQSGNFSVGSTWVGGQAPPDYENIVISAGHTVTLDRGTETINYIYVYDVTIEAGATLNSNGFPLYIRNTVSGTPHYINNGIHNGPGAIHAFNLSRGRVSGNGITNCDFLIENYGLEMTATTNLTINGNIMNSPGFPSNSSGIVFYINETGGNLIVNGDMISGATIRKAQISNFTGTLTVNGNITFAGTADWVVNRATLIISGNVTIGASSSSTLYNHRFVAEAPQPYLEIGGDLLGGGLCVFRNANDAHVKFGGLVFPTGFGGTLAFLSLTDLNTVEYNGTAAQVVKPFGTTAYRNLIISNTNATASIEAAVTANTSLVIKPGAALTVSGGSLTIGASATFTIESDATGTGSFISGSAVNANVKQYIAGHYGIGNNGWHLLSSPVAAQAISAFHTAGSGDDFFKWSDTEGLWINRTTQANGLNLDFEPNFVTGRGYLVAYETTGAKTFSGSINATDASVSGLTTLNGGWHLLGNHFSSAVKWNDGNWALNNVDAVAQVWVAADASYTPIVANDQIPAMNGFFVRADQTNASLTIPAAARAHNSTNWYKQTENQDRIVLRAIDHEGQTAQTTIIRFDGNATSGYDTEYDSYFLPGFAPQMYTYDQQDNKYALNTLPNQSEDLTIPLGFVKNQGNHFTIALADGYQGQSLYLSDQTTNQTVDLTQGSYSFSATGNDLSRFSLHFALVGIDETKISQPSLQAWHANGVLYINDVETGLLYIHDLLGRTVFKKQMSESTQLTLDLSLDPGVYIVQLRTSKGAKTAKINIQ
jgi:hypothetical protein